MLKAGLELWCGLAIEGEVVAPKTLIQVYVYMLSAKISADAQGNFGLWKHLVV